jgi:hypothetical protein
MKILIHFFCLSIVFTQTISSQNSLVNISSYDINAKLTLNSDNLDITLVCEIKPSDSLSEIQFIFTSEAKIQSVKYSKGDNWISIPYKFSGKDSLLLLFESGILPDNKYDLRFEYSFPTTLLKDSLVIIDRGHRWYPLILDQVAPFKLACDVSKRFHVLAAGDLISIKEKKDNNTFIWESKSAVFKLPLIIFDRSRFKKAAFDSSGINIDFFYLNADSIEATRVIKEAFKSVKFYSEHIGNYPYKKLTLFEVTEWEGINVGSGLIMVGSQSLEMMKQKYFESLNLTIAQQWFGAGVFAKYGSPGFWFLSLSLPHYLRLMYLRKLQGEESFLKSLNEPLTKYKEFARRENDIPIINVDSPNTREKGLILYGKGPYVLNKIHVVMGNENWLAFLQNLYKSFRGKILTYDEFEKQLSMYDENGSVLALLKKIITQKGIAEE